MRLAEIKSPYYLLSFLLLPGIMVFARNWIRYTQIQARLVPNHSITTAITSADEKNSSEGYIIGHKRKWMKKTF